MITETEWYHALWAAFQTFIITRLFQEALYLQKNKKKNMTDLSPLTLVKAWEKKALKFNIAGKKTASIWNQLLIYQNHWKGMNLICYWILVIDQHCTVVSEMTKLYYFMCSCLLVSKQTFKTKTRQQHMNEVMYINMEQMEHVSYTFCSSSQHNVHIHSVPPKWALATILDPRESHFCWLQHTSNYFLLFKLTNIWYCDTVAQ